MPGTRDRPLRHSDKVDPETAAPNARADAPAPEAPAAGVAPWPAPDAPLAPVADAPAADAPGLVAALPCLLPPGASGEAGAPPPALGVVEDDLGVPVAAGLAA